MQHSVDLVLLAGDAYKGRDPSQTQQRELARRLLRLSNAGVPTFLLPGNHDLPATTSRAHAVEIFSTLKVPNVYVGARPMCYPVPYAGRPFADPGPPLARPGRDAGARREPRPHH